MLTLAIQAGGKSTRMGEDKALKLFLGKPLIQRVVERLAPIADEIIITANPPTAYPFLNLPHYPDLQTGRGALGGLYTALSAAAHPLVAVVACDMPFASAELFQRARRILLDENADVVIAKTDSGYEPLHALYRRQTCLPAIESALRDGKWKVISWFDQVTVRILTPAELHASDPSGACFRNLNTPEEFSAAEKGGW